MSHDRRAMTDLAPHTPNEVREAFRGLFGAKARLFRAPGRVNLIGEHTDYNDGFVMPAAIDHRVWAAVSPRSDGQLVVRSTNFPDTVEIDLGKKDARKAHHWSDYVCGVAVMLVRAGHRLRGANLLIQGDVPIGAGLSSSAAVEVATALALLGNSGMTVERVELAKLCRRAENEFVGARVGIMDQFISGLAQAGHALWLDCRSMEHRFLPLPQDVSLVICNTMVTHQHAGSGYNTRRAECEEGVRLLSRSLPDIRALRDVTPEQLQRHAPELPATILKRCRHVVLENARVCAAAVALERGDLTGFGRLMRESHASLRDDYQVSCAELDLMVTLAENQAGVYGARMTGGGFGGCTISLVKSEAAAEFQRAVSAAYSARTGLNPQVWVSSAAAGADEVE
jgi:galactokinase